MFEIGIFCVILLAISYWAVLWLMGRREDVLHGEFVKADAAARPDPVRSVFPERPSLPERAALPERLALLGRPAPAAFAEKRVFPEKPVIDPKPADITKVQADITKPVRAAVAEQPAFRPERLQSLLNSIKQDLNQLVQK
jgi:hypothetical protein